MPWKIPVLTAFMCTLSMGMVTAAHAQSSADAASLLPVTISSGARLALFVDGTGAIVRSKGVTSVTQPTPNSGIFCIQPTTLNGKVIVPSVTPEQGTSSGNGTLFAYWVSDNRNCPAKNIEVLTGTGDFGGFTAANEPFALLVP